MLGPLTNPAGARAQVVGVYDPALVRTIAEVLARLGSQRAFVVHGAFGIDELSPAGPNLVCEVGRRRGASSGRSTRATTGSSRAAPEELRGGSPEQNAAVIRAVFSGEERGAKRDAILLNAAGAIAAGRPRGGPARRARARARGGRLGSGRGAARGAHRLLAMGSFRDALAGPGLAAVAEFKRRSPSLGDIRPDARIEELVPAYAAHGASAISVLVDERFAGTFAISAPREPRPTVPLLAKGFFSTEEHLRELREAGADAALLILRDLDDRTTAALMRVRGRDRPRHARRGARRGRARTGGRARRCP